MTSSTVTVPLMARRAYGTGRLFTKHGAWYGSWHRADGRRTTRKVGEKTGPQRLTKTDAEKQLRKMMLADNTGDRAQAGSTPTVKDLGDICVARLRRDRRKKSHIETFEGHLRKHINPAPLGDLPVTDVLEADVDRLIGRMLAAGLAPKTVRNVIGTLHAVLERAVRDHYIERNPAQMAELPRVPKSKTLRFLTIGELDRVLNAAPPDDDDLVAEHFPVGEKYGGPQAVRDWWPVVRLLILTAAMTGLRLGELRGLRWQDLGGKVRVRENFVRGVFDDPKSDLGSRGVPLAARLITALDDHHRVTAWNREDDLVLAHPHTGRPLDRVRLGYHYKAALRRAGVRQVRIHDLRHTFATTMAASGAVSLRTLQEWMGHEDIRTTQIYAHYMPGHREAELIDAAFTPRTPSGLQDSPTLSHTDETAPR